MNGVKRESILKLCLIALAMLPVFLFAYLGHFSRMIADDYCHFRLGEELGPLGIVVYTRDSWNGSYSNYLVHGLLAPIGETAPSFMPATIICLWLVGLAWLVLLAFRALGLTEHRWSMSIAFAALLIAAAINGFHSPQSFFWLPASVAYVLPPVIQVLSLALVLHLTNRQAARQQIFLVTCFWVLVCFISAGFAPMYVVFQGMLFTGLLLVALLFVDETVRRPAIVLIGMGLIATAGSALVQITAPGFAARLDGDHFAFSGSPIRYLPDLLVRSIEATLQYIGHQETFAGFMLALALALYATLSLHRPRISMEAARRGALVAPALWIGLITQLLFAPVLWLHTSDSPHMLDRFSFAYFIVICINAIQIIAFVFLLVFRRKTEEFLHKHKKWHVYITAILLATLAFFFLTQLRSVHFRAAAFLFASAFVLLCVAWSQLKSSVTNMPSMRFLWLPLFVSGLTLICYGGLIVLSLFAQGFVVGRVFAPVSSIHVLSGAFWGGVLGCLIRNSAIFRQNNGAWIPACKVACLIVLFAIGIGIVLGQLRMLPRLATFAREWDDRHAEIIRQRDSGSSIIVVPELSYDFGYDLLRWHIFDTQKGSRCSAAYYGVESIVRTEDGT